MIKKFKEKMSKYKNILILYRILKVNIKKVQNLFISILMKFLNSIIFIKDSNIRLSFRKAIYQAKAKEIILDYKNLMRFICLDNTSYCNAKCVFCSYPLKKDIKKETVTLKDYKDNLDKVINAGITYIDFTPALGDPLVDKYFLQKLSALHDTCIDRVRFFTNAIALRTEISDKIIQFKKQFNGRLWILFSIGGFDRETYIKIDGVNKFEVVMNNVIYFIEKNSIENTNIDITVCPKCRKELLKGHYYNKFKEFEKKNMINFRYEKTDYYGVRGTEEVKNSVKDNNIKFKKVNKKYFGPCDVMFGNGIRINVNGIYCIIVLNIMKILLLGI